MPVSVEAIEANVRTLFGKESWFVQHRTTETNLRVLSAVWDIPGFASLTPSKQKEAIIYCLFVKDRIEMVALWNLDSPEVTKFVTTIKNTLALAKILSPKLVEEIAQVSIDSTAAVIKGRRA